MEVDGKTPLMNDGHLFRRVSAWEDVAGCVVKCSGPGVRRLEV